MTHTVFRNLPAALFLMKHGESSLVEIDETFTLHFIELVRKGCPVDAEISGQLIPGHVKSEGAAPASGRHNLKMSHYAVTKTFFRKDLDAIELFDIVVGQQLHHAF